MYGYTVVSIQENELINSQNFNMMVCKELCNGTC